MKRRELNPKNWHSHTAKYPSIRNFQLLKEINTEIIDASEILLDCRYQKSPQELEMMSIAARISTYAMKAMIAAIRPGLRGWK